MSLPVHRNIPDGLNHKTGLKRQGLAPTGEPVALYGYRTRRGYWLTDMGRALVEGAQDSPMYRQLTQLVAGSKGR